MEFHHRLQQLRKQKGWSQEALGEQIHVTRQTVSKWEAGETTPEMNKLIELSRLFSISVDELTGVAPQEAARQAPSVALPRRYEYQSSRQLFGLPLVHIHVGMGVCRAKGIVAIGNVATGLLSIGGVSAGLISLGGASVGLLSFGAFSAALLLACGAISVGGVAVGGVALGLFAIGGVACGLYSLGGFAAALRVAAGGFAHAPVAIGDQGVGTVWLDVHSATAEQIEAAIRQAFPQMPEILLWLFRSVGGVA